MPTGYTSKVQDGEITELKDFILNCAKGFGAFSKVKLDPSNNQLILAEVGEYYERKLEECTRKLAKYNSMTDDEIKIEIGKSVSENIKSMIEYRDKFYKQLKNYNDMISKVERWEVPSEEHRELKNFALKQLNDSRNFDCSEDFLDTYCKMPTEEDIPSISEWRNKHINKVLKDIAYYSKELIKERDSIEEYNKWAIDLVNSLNNHTTDVDSKRF